MVEREKVTPDATFETLGLKSIDIVMVLTAVEEKFDVYIPMDGSIAEAKDLRSFIDEVIQRIAGEQA
jgi:acyl carrier protein